MLLSAIKTKRDLKLLQAVYNEDFLSDGQKDGGFRKGLSSNSFEFFDKGLIKECVYNRQICAESSLTVRAECAVTYFMKFVIFFLCYFLFSS